MPIQKLIISSLVSASFLLGSVFAADKPATLAEVEKLQEQVRVIDKDLTVLKEGANLKIEALEKRQNEITAQQANSLAAISIQTTTVGNYIAITSIVVSILVLGAGFITYFGATRKAKDEAREASEKWFNDNELGLRKQIADLKRQADEATSQIGHEVNKVAAASTTAQADIQVTAAQATSVLNASNADITGQAATTADPQAVKVVRDAKEALKTKPESEFTAEDFFAKGLAYFTELNYQSALEAFKAASAALSPSATNKQKAQYLFAQGVTLGALGKSDEAITVYDALDQRFGNDTAPAVREQVVKGLVNKGVRLGALGKFDEAITVYDALDQRFGNDTAPGVREQVVRTFNGKGFAQIMLAKQRWAEATLRSEYLAAAVTVLQRSLLECAKDDRAMVSGNLGYAQFLSGQQEAAEAATLKCLQLGGQKSLDAQLADAKLHRVEPEDIDYEILLNRLWASFKPDQET